MGNVEETEKCTFIPEICQLLPKIYKMFLRNERAHHRSDKKLRSRLLLETNTSYYNLVAEGLI
jgi:hypothetical protein